MPKFRCICNNNAVDIITSHLNADFDAFASMAAAQKLYPEARLVLPGAQEKRLHDFLETTGGFPTLKIKDLNLADVTRLIIVDTKSPDRIGQLSGLLDREGLIVHLYDHHHHGTGDIRGAHEVIEKVGATATIFTELLLEREIRPEPVLATLLLLGIYEETGNMLFPSTTGRDLRAAAHLLHWGASLKAVSDCLRTEMSREEVDLLSELSHSARTTYAGGIKIITALASREGYVGDAAQFAGKLLEMEYADASFIIIRMQGKVLIVGRSRVPELNVADVLSELGGGGHPGASSATVDDQPLELLEETVIGLVRTTVKPGKLASDIMTKPVITVGASIPIREAQTMLTKYGVNVLPVMEDGKLIGLLIREIVEKAILHGFRKSPAREFADTDMIIVTPKTPIREIESAMIEQNQRFVPVLDGGALVGAITRTDILRVIYEDHLRRSGISRQETGEIREHANRNMAPLLQNRYPLTVYDTLHVAGEVAQGMGMDAYLVGGSVRDMMRGKENLDIDLVVEGDGIAFARAMAARLGGRMKSHERFGTAKIITDALRLDVATARTEYYESPAALPKVEMSSIKKDLYRRDFTVNTLAIKLTGQDFGRLADFFGGMKDLKDKTIRVLHNLSFVEDPTRAFRAVRFAERFGFKISKHTEDLMRSAIRLNIFSKLSGTRLYEELMLAFEEPDPHGVIARLDHYGLLGIIHPALTLDDELRTILTSVHDTLLWFDLSFTGERVQRRIVWLMGLVGGLHEEEREAALGRLSSPKKTHDKVLKDIRAARETIKRMPFGDAARLHSALSALDTETVLYIMALAEGQGVKQEVSQYLLRLRREKTILTGNDLKEMGIEPGPVYSELLGGVLAGRLRGRITSKEDEMRYVLAQLRGQAG